MNNWNKCNKCSEKLPDRTIECISIYKRCGKIAKYNYNRKQFEYFDYGIGDRQPYCWNNSTLLLE